MFEWCFKEAFGEFRSISGAFKGVCNDIKGLQKVSESSQRGFNGFRSIKSALGTLKGISEES